MRERKQGPKALAVLLLAGSLGLSGASAAPGGQEAATEQVAKKVFPSVVKVEARNGHVKVATGVVIDKDGHIVTTGLIWTKGEDIVVTTSEGKKTQAAFLGFDPETNLAVLRAKDKGLTPIVPAGSGVVVPGAWIGVVSMSPENTPAITQGIVSSVAPGRLRLNVWVTLGSSGSPVVNKDGQMVGLLRGIYAEDQPVVFEFREREVVGSGFVFDRAEAPSSGMALGIPLETVLAVAGEIRETGKVSRPWLGVAIGENEEGRVVVGRVEPDSPAELAKLKEDDIVLAVDGRAVPSAAAFVAEIRNRKPGRDLELKVERGGKPLNLKAKLGEYPEAEARKEMAARFPRLFPPAGPLAPEAPDKPGESPETRRENRKFWVPATPDEPAAGPLWGKRKYIGLYLEPLTEDLLEYFGVKEDSGLLVNRLTKDGPAERAGVKVGDVIVRADGRGIASVGDLSGLIQDRKKGDKVKLEIIRDKKPVTVEVEVGEEESSGLSELFRSIPSSEAWETMSRDLAREYGRSGKAYEKYAADQRYQMKKLAEEMTEQGKKYEELAKQYSLKGKAQADKLRKVITSKKQALHRV